MYSKQMFKYPMTLPSFQFKSSKSKSSYCLASCIPSLQSVLNIIALSPYHDFILIACYLTTESLPLWLLAPQELWDAITTYKKALWHFNLSISPSFKAQGYTFSFSRTRLGALEKSAICSWTVVTFQGAALHSWSLYIPSLFGLQTNQKCDSPLSWNESIIKGGRWGKEIAW